MSNQTKKNDTSGEGTGFSEEMRILEALLFASDEVMSPAKLKSVIPGEPDARKIRGMVRDLNQLLQSQRHPFEIVELGGGYQFKTVPYYHPWVRQLLKEKSTKKISIQGLECLAIIAYKQPITKAEIESIRGVLSDGAMKTLLERRMVTPVGRSDKAGRPLLYGTTKEFLEYFGINKVVDLPRIEEFEAIAKEKMEELSDDELSVIESVPEERTSEETGETSEHLSGDAAADEEDAVEKAETEEAEGAPQPDVEPQHEGEEGEAAETQGPNAGMAAEESSSDGPQGDVNDLAHALDDVLSGGGTNDFDLPESQDPNEEPTA